MDDDACGGCITLYREDDFSVPTIRLDNAKIGVLVTCGVSIIRHFEDDYGKGDVEESSPPPPHPIQGMESKAQPIGK